MTHGQQLEERLKVRSGIGAVYADSGLVSANSFMMVFQELGALSNGVSAGVEREMKEIFPRATVYCAIPAGPDASEAAHEVLRPKVRSRRTLSYHRRQCAYASQSASRH